MGKFVIRNVPTGMKFDLRATNGEMIATGEVYTTLASCHRGIEAVRRCAAAGKVLDATQPHPAPVTNPKFEIFQDKRGAYRFRMRARNGETIAHSEPYASKTACLEGVDSVMENAPTAEVEME